MSPTTPSNTTRMAHGSSLSKFVPPRPATCLEEFSSLIPPNVSPIPTPKQKKVFVYLNDVSSANGATRYVPGSFRNISCVIDKLGGYNHYGMSQRVPSQMIEDCYPGSSIIQEGVAGTVVLEDTRGWHSGLPLLSGYRHVVQYEFASSTYRFPDQFPPQLKLPASLLPGAVQMAAARLGKRLFQRFTFTGRLQPAR